MKKRKYMMIGTGILLLLLLCVGNAFTNSSGKSLLSQWGNILNRTQKENPGGDIYAQGKNTVVLRKDVEQAKEFYILSGMEDAAALDRAETYMYEREAMYHLATEKGYQATDEQVRAYLEELKKTANSAANKDDVFALIDQFDSEEAYWDYQFEVYKKNLPIQNYVQDLKRQYVTDAANPEEAWDDHFEALKAEAVSNEHFRKTE